MVVERRLRMYGRSGRRGTLGDMAASDDPASAEGAAAGGDDFGVRLSWPEEGPATKHRRRPVRRLDEQPGAPAGPVGGTPVLPELAARVEKLQSLVRSVLTRVDAHQDSSLAAIEALSAKIHQTSEPADLGQDAIGRLEGGIDSLASDIAELRTELAQVKRRLPVRAKAESDAVLVDSIVAAVHERLGSDLGLQIADIVVNRLFDVVEVVEIDEAAPPPAPPERPVAATRRPSRRPTGRR
jgi:hypothetical protein